MGSKRDRKRYFIDPQVQGMLLRRAARYWFLSLALVGCLTLLGWVFVSPGIGPLVASPANLSATLSAMLVAIGAAILLLPIALLDLIRVSNRFVGPVYRLRGLMEKVAQGEPVAPLRFRDGDAWQEFADAFNAVVRRIEHLEKCKRDLEVAQGLGASDSNYNEKTESAV